MSPLSAVLLTRGGELALQKTPAVSWGEGEPGFATLALSLEEGSVRFTSGVTRRVCSLFGFSCRCGGSRDSRWSNSRTAALLALYAPSRAFSVAPSLGGAVSCFHFSIFLVARGRPRSPLLPYVRVLVTASLAVVSRSEFL